MAFLQGEVYRYLPTDDLGPAREGEHGHRALIVFDEMFNRGGHIWTILLTTKKNDFPPLGSWVRFDASAEFGLTQTCIAQGESLTRSPVRYLGDRLGRISDQKMSEIVEAIGHVMVASCFFR
jgi:mRNA-degrading endonuclease toxin of MazEF toxin-antitoxin module